MKSLLDKSELCTLLVERTPYHDTVFFSFLRFLFSSLFFLIMVRTIRRRYSTITQSLISSDPLSERKQKEKKKLKKRKDNMCCGRVYIPLVIYTSRYCLIKASSKSKRHLYQ